MSSIPVNPETEAMTRRVAWFDEPVVSLADSIRFRAFATHQGVRLLRRYVPDKDSRDALDTPPHGVIGPRSRPYRICRIGRYPPPPHPTRRIK